MEEQARQVEGPRRWQLVVRGSSAHEHDELPHVGKSHMLTLGCSCCLLGVGRWRDCKPDALFLLLGWELGTLSKKKRHYLGNFPNMGGGSSQIPKLL